MQHNNIAVPDKITPEQRIASRSAAMSINWLEVIQLL